MISKDRIALGEFVLDQAKKLGAQSSSVRIATERSVQVEVRTGQIDKLQESVAQSLSLGLYVDGKYSSHSTQKLDRPALTSFIEEAVALTRYLTADPFRCLPEPELSKLETGIDLKSVDPRYQTLEMPQRIALAKAAEAAARAATGGACLSSSAGYGDSHVQVSALNSNGFRGEHEATGFNLSADATVKDGDKGRPEDYAYGSVRHFADLPLPEQLGREAAERALAKRGQTKLPSGAYDLLIENRVAGQLLRGLLDPMGAASLQQKSSWLDGKLGKKIASEKLTLVDDPFLPKGLGSRRFDGDALGLRRRVLVEGGILKAYLVDNYFGRKLKLTPTGGGITNLTLPGGEGNLEALLKNLNRGILVQGFIGGNYNGTTGDFSYGIMGQLVENGRIVKAVNEMNLTGNMLDLWSRLEGTGADLNVNSSLRLPSLLFRGLELSGS